MIQIYRLFSNTCSSFYVGSTERTLEKRFSKHKNKAHETPKRKVYKVILENGGFKEWKMEPLEVIEGGDTMTRRMREQHWIDQLNPDLNSCLAFKG